MVVSLIYADLTCVSVTILRLYFSILFEYFSMPFIGMGPDIFDEGKRERELAQCSSYVAFFLMMSQVEQHLKNKSSDFRWKLEIKHARRVRAKD